MKTVLTIACGVSLACASVASGAYSIDNVSVFGNAVYNLSGEPGLGSDSSSDSDSWPVSAPTPYGLSMNAALSLPTTGGGSFYNAIVSNSSSHESDGVEGTMSQQYEWAMSSAASGNFSSTVRTQAIFTVTGWAGWDLQAFFTDSGAGNFVEIKNEDTGDIVFQEALGATVDASGVLADGTYRFTARMLFNRSGSIGNSSGLVQRQMQFDLTLDQVPAPASGCVLLGALATVRRRR